MGTALPGTRFVCALAAVLAPLAARAADHRLLPADTEIVVTFNARQALDGRASLTFYDAARDIIGARLRHDLHNLWQWDIRNRIFVYDEIERLLKESGFEATRDLDCATLAYPAGPKPLDVCVVLEGRFAQDKFLTVAKAIAKENPTQLRCVREGQTMMFAIQRRQDREFVDIAWLGLVNNKALILTYREKRLREVLAQAQRPGVHATKIAPLLSRLNDRQTLSYALTSNAVGKGYQPGDQNPGDWPWSIVLSRYVTERIVGEGWWKEAGKPSLCAALSLTRDAECELHLVGLKDTEFALGVVQQVNLLRAMGVQWARDQREQGGFRQPLVDLLSTLRVGHAERDVSLSASAAYASFWGAWDLVPRGWFGQ